MSSQFKYVAIGKRAWARRDAILSMREGKRYEYKREGKTLVNVGGEVLVVEPEYVEPIWAMVAGEVNDG